MHGAPMRHTLVASEGPARAGFSSGRRAAHSKRGRLRCFVAAMWLSVQRSSPSIRH